MTNNKVDSKMTPSIPEWYRNRNVLITGGTGFLGKVLIVKLLQACPDIGNIFLLIREKKGMEPQARVQQILQEDAFKGLRENHPDRLKKLVVVPSDTTKEGLALSASDYKRITEEVSVIIHMAANVKFNSSLKTAVNDNIKATLQMISLAKQVSKLVSFMYVSTAFSQINESVLEERAYSPSIAPEKILTLIDTVDDHVLEEIKPKLLKKYPNCYAFTKSLCEDLIVSSGLPAGVSRPSLVVPCWKEPLPGWIDNTNGLTGVIIGAGKGVIRTMLCNRDNITEMVPCDIVVNAILAHTWKVGLEQPKTPIFINVTKGEENPLTWGDSVEIGRKHTVQYPFSGPLWYPGGNITSWKIVHWFSVMFFHLLPAYFVDALCLLTGHQPFLIKIQSKITTGLGLIAYYTVNAWNFRNDGMKALYKELCPSDKEEFYMDLNAISWNDYLLDYVLGVRKYCLKDDPSSLPRARKVMSYLYYAHHILKLLFIGLFLWIVFSWMTPFRGMLKSLILTDSLKYHVENTPTKL